MRTSLKVGKKVIVGIPNFAYIKARGQIFFKGRVPVTPSLPYEWHNTPNLHFLSLLDFIKYCREQNIIMENTCYLNKTNRVRFMPNLFAQTGLFLLRKNNNTERGKSA